MRHEPNPWRKTSTKRFPLDTQVQSLWLPAIRAQTGVEPQEP
jgi:hypothetical protein